MELWIYMNLLFYFHHLQLIMLVNYDKNSENYYNARLTPLKSSDIPFYHILSILTA